MKRALISVLISAAMVIGPLPAMSADTGPLPSGTAAGVKQAQGNNDEETPLLWLVGAGVIIGLGILILSNNNNNSAAPVTPATTTTTTTTTSPAPVTPPVTATTTT